MNTYEYHQHVYATLIIHEMFLYSLQAFEEADFDAVLFSEWVSFGESRVQIELKTVIVIIISFCGNLRADILESKIHLVIRTSLQYQDIPHM